MKSQLLVPTDFSEAADKALSHAVYTSSKSGAKIYLLHFCKSPDDMAAATTDLEGQLSKADLKGVEVEQVVRLGDFKNIPTVAIELKADLIFMGTHGANGMQKILGSNALKLVTKSEVPFIIVQKDSPEPAGYDRIIVPTTFHFENKQKVNAIGQIANYFGSKIYFIYNTIDDRIKEKSLMNLKGMKNYLRKKGIEFEVETSETKKFNVDTMDLTAKVEANLIAIMNMQKNDILGTGIFGQNFEQELIMNDQQIPVLIVNPKFTRLGGSVLM